MNEALQKHLQKLTSQIDSLRVMVKYLVFDLEATKRENERLRKLYEDNRK